jgi:hypothetical protein
MHSRRPGAESDRLAADESANQNPTDPTLAQPPDSQARAALDPLDQRLRRPISIVCGSIRRSIDTLAHITAASQTSVPMTAP